MRIATAGRLSILVLSDSSDVAMRHLDQWCQSSRMRFGAEKTQIVVFTLRKTPDTTPFSSLQLCNFTVAVANHYNILVPPVSSHG